MSAITLPALAEIPQLRPLNILRDLPAVADLVETCFANTMDAEGRRYIQQMRRAGQDNRFLRWAVTAVETVSMPLSGYVWEENGAIIGNVSVIPYRYAGERVYLIANVAVRADCRRRGIGRALTVAGMRHARQHHADETWLHVRDDNPGAVALYQDLGFRERASRTTWQANTDGNANPDGLGVGLSARQARDWPQQEEWLHRLYPDLMAWYQPMPWNSLRPGLWPALYRFFMESHARHWAVHADGKLLAVLSWQPVYGSPDRLWAAVPPEADGTPLTALLLNARQALSWRVTLNLEFPAGLNAAAIQAAGFRPQRTLLWMQTSQAAVR